jgi:hypothetical protein
LQFGEHLLRRGADGTGGLDRIAPGQNCLSEIRPQLVGFECQATCVLLHDIVAREAADPQRGGKRKACRQGDHQPADGRHQAATRIESVQAGD